MSTTFDKDDAVKRCVAWYNYFLMWKRLSWTLSVLIAGGSAFVASKIAAPDTAQNALSIRDWAALVVAVLAAISAALTPEKRAQAYREAWIILDLALKKESGVADSLIEALRKGENRIGDTHAEKEAEISSRATTHS